MSQQPLPEKPLRLDKETRIALLGANEGFTDSTHYSGKNFTESRKYEIRDGTLHVHSNSKSSWADSRRTSDYVADEGATHRFLRENLPFLDTDGVRERAAELKAERRAAERAAKVERDSARTAAAEAGATVTPVSLQAAGRNGIDQRVYWGIAAAWALVALAPRAKQAWDIKARPALAARRARRDEQKTGRTEAKQDGPTEPAGDDTDI